LFLFVYRTTLSVLFLIVAYVSHTESFKIEYSLEENSIYDGLEGLLRYNFHYGAEDIKCMMNYFRENDVAARFVGGPRIIRINKNENFILKAKIECNEKKEEEKNKEKERIYEKLGEILRKNFGFTSKGENNTECMIKNFKQNDVAARFIGMKNITIDKDDDFMKAAERMCPPSFWMKVVGMLILLVLLIIPILLVRACFKACKAKNQIVYVRHFTVQV
jgi:hypothetical protein